MCSDVRVCPGLEQVQSEPIGTRRPGTRNSGRLLSGTQESVSTKLGEGDAELQKLSEGILVAI